MAENPATWGPVEKTIHEAIKDWTEGRARGVVGLSLPATIAFKLRGEGLLNG